MKANENVLDNFVSAENFRGLFRIFEIVQRSERSWCKVDEDVLDVQAC